MAAQLADHLRIAARRSTWPTWRTRCRSGAADSRIAWPSLPRAPAQAAQALRAADDRCADMRAGAPPRRRWCGCSLAKGRNTRAWGAPCTRTTVPFALRWTKAPTHSQPVLAFDLKARLFGDAADALAATATTQPATFCLEYALAQAWLARGVRPAALIGHSVGEFVAAVLAGVMPLADAARLVARRGALMQALPTGSMLSVRLPAAKVIERLPPELSLAADNGPTACVVAGPDAAVQAFAAALRNRRGGGACAADLARLPFRDDGSGGRALRSRGAQHPARCAAHSDRVDADRRLDDRGRGDRPALLGAPSARAGALLAGSAHGAGRVPNVALPRGRAARQLCRRWRASMAGPARVRWSRWRAWATAPSPK